MRLWLWVGAAIVAAGLAVGLGAWLVTDDPPPAPEAFVDQSFDDLDPGATWVRLTGTAHYDAMVRSTRPATLWSPEQTWHLVGFFPENDTSNREIPVLVRTQRPPERLVSFETMTVEGRLRTVTDDVLSPGTEALLSKRTGYFFADRVLLLDAVRVVSEDGVWTEPR